MNCADFEHEWHLLLDGSAPAESSELAAHLAVCAACSAEWEKGRLLADAIVSWRGQVPAVDLAPGIVAAHRNTIAGLTADPPVAPTPVSLASIAPLPFTQRAVSHRARQTIRSSTKPAALRQGRWALGAAAAALAALVGISALLTPRDRGEDDSPARSVTQVPPDSAVKPDDLMPPNDPVMVHRAQAAYGALAHRAADAFEQIALIVLPVPAAGKPHVVEDRTDGPWLEGLEHQLRPIGRGVEDTFDFLWQVGQPAEDSRT